MPVDLAAEGPTDLAVMRRLLVEAGLDEGEVFWGEGRNTGKQGMTSRLQGWVAGAAVGRRIFVLRDLDHDAPCAGALRAALPPHDAPGLLLRVAVRQVEAWLIADRDRLAQALHVDPQRLPADPEAHPDPKQAIMEAAARSRSRAIKRGLPPRPGSGLRHGDDYAETLIGFARSTWSPRAAALRSDSLRRALLRLAEMRDLLRHVSP